MEGTRTEKDALVRLPRGTYKMEFCCQTSHIATYSRSDSQTTKDPSIQGTLSSKLQIEQGESNERRTGCGQREASGQAGKHTLKVRGVSFRKLLRRSVRGRDTCPWTLTLTHTVQSAGTKICVKSGNGKMPPAIDFPCFGSSAPYRVQPAHGWIRSTNIF